MKDLTQYRASELEKKRIADLLNMIPCTHGKVLDIGARDGFVSLQLAQRFAVTALDLEPPHIEHPAINCVGGNACSLDFAEDAFEVVLCAEVLEHIPSALLPAACSEMARVSSKYVIVGVPYRQDIRVGRTVCLACNQPNPPWGHVNVFDEDILKKLFPQSLTWGKASYVGENRESTNIFSMALAEWARYPYGTYDQEEPCIHCGSVLVRPRISVLQHVAALSARMVCKVQSMLIQPRPNWIHVRFIKRGPGENAP